MMRRALSLAVAACTAVTFGSAKAAAQEKLSLVEAFQRVCVATNARPLEVEKAIYALGGRETRPLAATTWPFHMTAHIFELPVDGEPAMINVGGIIEPARAGHRGTNEEGCDITTRRRNDAAIVAIRAWAGVPVFKGGANLLYFSFVTTPRGHAPPPKVREQTVHAEREGRSWTLIIFRTESSEVLQLIHHLGSPSPP